MFYNLYMNKYYDGTKLLSLTDINGNKPEIYICSTNRSGGKTTFFSRYLVKRFLNHGEKFCIEYRFNYELDDCADKFFKGIRDLFFVRSKMTSKSKMNGKYRELLIDEKPCGYAIALNDADQIKKNSHLFSDTQRMLFDEFQSETNHYCSDEVKKFISIHQSIARGDGEQSRYLPVYMLSNPVTILNPYYTALGIAARLNDNTKFLRGDGFVMEQGYVAHASEELKKSGFNRAFSSSDYMAYATEAIYLNDNKAFITKPSGKSRYLVTLKYKGSEYGIREYAADGIIYVDDKPDKTDINKITVTTEDHNVNYVMLKRNDLFLSNMRYYFERGCFRFKDLKCKEALLCALSY